MKNITCQLNWQVCIQDFVLSTDQLRCHGRSLHRRISPIRTFLKSSSTNLNLSQDQRDLASSLTQQPSLSYKSLKCIWILDLLCGSNLIFTSPNTRENSQELKGRLRKLAVVSEKKEYEELVKDITPRKPVQEPFSSYKDQLRFGLHVIVTIFTGYLVGYAAFRALFSDNVAMSAAGGILGLVVSMLVETFIFIIRFSNRDDQPNAFASEIIKNQ